MMTTIITILLLPRHFLQISMKKSFLQQPQQILISNNSSNFKDSNNNDKDNNNTKTMLQLTNSQCQRFPQCLTKGILDQRIPATAIIIIKINSLPSWFKIVLDLAPRPFNNKISNNQINNIKAVIINMIILRSEE